MVQRTLVLNGSPLAIEHRMCAKDIASESFDGTNLIYDYGVNDHDFQDCCGQFFRLEALRKNLRTCRLHKRLDQSRWSETTTFAGTNLFTNSSDVWSPANKVPAQPITQPKAGGCLSDIKQRDYEGNSITRLITLSLNGTTDDGDEDVHYSDCLADGLRTIWPCRLFCPGLTITSNTGGANAILSSIGCIYDCDFREEILAP